MCYQCQFVLFLNVSASTQILHFHSTSATDATYTTHDPIRKLMLVSASQVLLNWNTVECTRGHNSLKKKKWKCIWIMFSCSIVVVFYFSINQLLIFRLITLVSASLAHATAVPRTSAGTAQHRVSALWTLHWNSHLRWAAVYSMLILWIINAFSF